MIKIKCLPVALLLLLLATVASAQNRTLTGKITNATGEPLSGVTITTSEKKPESANTDGEGRYSLIVRPDVKTVVVSHVGYFTQTITLTDKNVLDITLQVNPAAMDEVVVIGYGTQKKSHLTGAISKYKNEKLDEAPVSRLDQALQGKIAGVQVQNLTSEAGADPKIRVRGINSINASPEPLVVVDGHPLGNGMSFVNMADVESVEVLKDAASAAIYGSRAANGVIIITTKSGKADKPKYGIKFSSGVKTAYEIYPMMSTTEYSNLLFYEASLKLKDPSIPPPTPAQIISNNERAAYIVESTILGGIGTNWQEQALRNATVRNLQLNVSGGKREVKYYISGAYQRDQGLMYHSEYDRFSLRARTDIQLSKKARLTFNLNPTYSKRERPSVNYIDFVRFQSFLPVYHNATTAAFVNQVSQWANIKPGDFAQARHFNGRVYSGTMPDGSTWVNTSAVDPFNTANNTPKSIMESRTINSNDYRLLGSGDLTYTIIPGLDFKAMVSGYVSYQNVVDFAKRNSTKDGDINRGVFSNRLIIDLLSENTLTYNKKVKDHTFTLLAGFTSQQTKTREEQTTGLDFPSDNVPSLNTALQIDQAKDATFNRRNQSGLLSVLGRVLYDYKSKYLLSASFRRDGSSFFGPGHKWGSFPSVSVGWVVTEEKFMQRLDWLNQFKIRTSYGATGNNNIPPFAWIDLLYAANYPFGAGTGTATSGQAPSRDFIANPDITWETTYQLNGGIDLGFLNNTINLSVDVYQSKTKKLLLQQQTMAFTGMANTWNNIGRMRNNGIEVELTTNNIRKRNFKWTTSANISRNKNKILELGGEAFLLNQGERTELYMNRVGDPLVQFFAYKTDGVWLSQAEIDAAKAAGLTSNLSNFFVPGGLKLVDVNGDKVVDANDRVVVGSPYPDFTWGITNTLTYKAFDISFMFQGIQGAQLINGDANYNETKRYNKNYNNNRWLSPGNPGDGKTPYSTFGFNWMLTDYVAEDASYTALREVIVGYTLPAKWAKSLHLGSARLYFSAYNLYFKMADGYRGINPEARFLTGPYATPGTDGYQRGSYPMPKTYLFGLDVNF
jgi:TonB-dependent starch-binding outer membrane protein SusC